MAEHLLLNKNKKVKKFFLYIALILIAINSNCQTTLSLYFYDPCSDTVAVLKDFVLEANGQTYIPEMDTNTITGLDTGFYNLSVFFHDELLPYRISEFGHIKDTIAGKTIKFMIEPTTNPSYSGYYCCNDECDGRQIDFYPNGNKRIEGNFVEGRPLGNLKIFYPNGNIKRIDKYSKKGKLKKRIYFSPNKSKIKVERF